jgi:hypothetical protein
MKARLLKRLRREAFENVKIVFDGTFYRLLIYKQPIGTCQDFVPTLSDFRTENIEKAKEELKNFRILWMRGYILSVECDKRGLRIKKLNEELAAL